MGKEALNSEELEAVKELIKKIPPEDLENAVGGLDKKYKKYLLGAGIIAAAYLGINYINRDRPTEREDEPLPLPPKKKKSEFFTKGRLWGYNLKKGYYEYNGKIYNIDDMVSGEDDGMLGAAVLEPRVGAIPVATVSELDNDFK